MARLQGLREQLREAVAVQPLCCCAAGACARPCSAACSARTPRPAQHNELERTADTRGWDLKRASCKEQVPDGIPCITSSTGLERGCASDLGHFCEMNSIPARTPADTGTCCLHAGPWHAKARLLWRPGVRAHGPFALRPKRVLGRAAAPASRQPKSWDSTPGVRDAPGCQGIITAL